jgi:ferrous iron transport protein A
MPPMTIKLLSDLEGGERGRVVRIGVTGSIRRRLMDMGLVTGSDVEMERVAPLGDPIEIKIKGYDLSLRKEVASRIEVDVMEIPLCATTPGKPLTVIGFRGGHGMQRRLADMGLTPGTALKLISCDRHGPVIIEVRGARLALGRGIAHHILVRES